jgi:hypothetical protein
MHDKITNAQLETVGIGFNADGEAVITGFV